MCRLMLIPARRVFALMIKDRVTIGNSSKRYLFGAIDKEKQPLPLTGFTCKVAVVNEDTDEIVIAQREVTEIYSDGLKFVVQLTKAETTQLVAGAVYAIVVEIENTSMPFDQEVKKYFKATRGYIT